MAPPSTQHQEALDAWIDQATTDLTRGARKRLREEYLDHYQEAYGKAMESDASEDSAHIKAMESLGESTAAQRASLLIHADPHRLRAKMVLLTLGAILISASWYYATSVRTVLPYDVEGLKQALELGRQKNALKILDIGIESSDWAGIMEEPVLQTVLEHPSEYSANLFRDFLEKGADPNFFTPESPNLLVHQLIKFNRIDPDNVFPDRYPDVYRGNWRHYGRWHYFEKQRMEILDMLVEADVSLELKDDQGWTPMTLAAYEGDTALVERLRKLGADESPEALVYNYNFETLKAEIEKNPALVKNRYAKNATLFMLSAPRAPTKFLKYLVEVGADPMVVNNQGRTALHMAVYGFCRLHQARSRETPQEHSDSLAEMLHESLQYLIDSGINVNAYDTMEYVKLPFKAPASTPLHFAALFGVYEVVRILLDNGADVNLPNSHGSTALILAAGRTNQSTALLLIDRGADVRHSSHRGYTALHSAVRSPYHLPLVKRLVSEGARVNAINGVGGGTPIASSGSIEIVKFLMDSGADINVQNAGDGNTLLHQAVNGRLRNPGFNNLVAWFLELGVDPTIRNRYGKTAAQLARQHGHAVTANLLEKAEKTWETQQAVLQR
ncbi:MAG: hypothetical protein COA73_15075 [Candidatus Hydrogenedentota bacterium]|nr:MAG: hypothetical protein COA73_15075 [Candidatus Hydrogenedentota bacterium]